MRNFPTYFWLWPGLTQMWLRGAWSGLAWAVGFTLALNLALITTFVWPAWFPSGTVSSLWGVTLGIWGTAAWVSWREARRPAPEAVEPERDKFCLAQAEYLKGNWYEAESLLEQQLKKRPEDIESGLLLATLLRHMRRLDEARERLQKLLLWEKAEAWRLEIDGELLRLADLTAEMVAETQEKQTSNSESLASPPASTSPPTTLSNPQANPQTVAYHRANPPADAA